LQFKNFRDPSFSSDAAANAAPCTAALTTPCQYSIAYNGSTVSSSTIYFFTESTANSLTGGNVHTIDQNGVFVD
jgi:hypothetical protein